MGKEKYFKFEAPQKVDEYKGTAVYTSNKTPREWVASMSPGGCIEIHPDAFALLKKKPDYLERIYKHEIKEGPLHEPHPFADQDILLYLKEKGYDFGKLSV